MKTARLPDGTLVNFPDDATPEEMTSAVNKLDASRPATPALAQAPTETDSPGWWEGRFANVKAGVSDVLGSLATEIASPQQNVMAELFGKNPEDIGIDVGGFSLTDFAKGQFAKAGQERKIQGASTPDNPLAKFGTEAIDSIVNMAPSIATARLTKGADIGLAVMGGQVFADSYSRALNDGMDRGNALRYAAKQVAYEIGPEKALGFFDNLPGAAGLKDWLKQATVEAASEIVTEGANVADESQLQGKDVGSWLDVLKRLGYAGLQGAVIGGGATITVPFHTPTEAVPRQSKKEALDLHREYQDRLDRARYSSSFTNGNSGIAEASPAIQELQTPATQPAPIAPQEQPITAPQAKPIPARVEGPIDVNAPPEGELAAPPEKTYKAYKKGGKFEAIDLGNGKFKVRRRPRISVPFGQWEVVDHLDTAGLSPLTRPSGVLQISPDEKYRIHETPEPDTSPRGPVTLLQNLAEGPKLNRQAFEQEFGLDRADTMARHSGLKSAFTDKGGMTPDDFREWLQQEHYVNEESPDAPDRFTPDDAYALLDRALSGERIVSQDLQEQEDRYQWERNQADEAAREESLAKEDVNAGKESVFSGFDEDPGMSDEEFDQLSDQIWEKVKDNVNEGTIQAATTERPATAPAARETAAEPTAEPAAAEPAGPEVAANEPALTSLKNAVVDMERQNRQVAPIFSEAVKSNPQTMAEARQALTENPSAADEIIRRLNTDSEAEINDTDQAVLLIHKIEVMNAREDAANRAGNDSLEQNQRDVAAEKWQELEDQLEEIDQATRRSGTIAGRMLQFRTRLADMDFTLAAMEQRARVARRRPLTIEESRVIKQQAEEIARLRNAKAASDEQVLKLRIEAESRAVHEQLAQKFADRGKKKKRPWLEELNRKADESRAILKQSLGRTNAGVDPTMYFHVVRIGAAHVANGIVKFTDWVSAMKTDLGAKVWGQVEEQAETIFDDSVKHAKADAVEAGERLAADVVAEVRAEQMAGLELDHRLVYELARAHILQGVTGENAVMSAVHKDLEPFFEGLTERDVRRAFSEYGKAKFPSKQADRVALSELRNLVRLQESIDRLKENLAPLKTGLQRNKITQKIREKQRELNALMRAREQSNPEPSPARLAGVNEARLTRLRNQVADLNKQLETGQKPTRGPEVAPTPEVQDLMRLRDALKDKIREIELAKNPPPTAEEKYNITRGKQLRRQLKEVQERLAADNYARKERKVPPKLTKENQQLALDLEKAKFAFSNAQYEYELSQESTFKRTARKGWRALSILRSVRTAIDLGHFLRQAAIPVLSHPISAMKTIVVPALRAARSERGALAVMNELKADPIHQKLKDWGVFFGNQLDAHPSKREEVYMDSLTSKIPGVAWSARSYTVGLNAVRQWYGHVLVDAFERNGVITEKEGKHIAYWINRGTGRGTLKGFQDVGPAQVFFAPRWVQSRFPIITLLPVFKAPTARVRTAIGAEYLRFLGGWFVLNQLIGNALALLGDDDEDKPYLTWDPRSTRFGRLTLGPTMIDLTGGLSIPIVFLTRLLWGEKKTLSGDVRPLRGDVPYGSDDEVDIMKNFVRSKTSPAVSAATNLIAGKDITGQETSLAREVGQLFVPLSMADLYTTAKQQDIPETAIIQILSFLGAGVNTIADRKEKERGPRRPKPPTPPERPKRPGS